MSPGTLGQADTGRGSIDTGVQASTGERLGPACSLLAHLGSTTTSAGQLVASLIQLCFLACWQNIGLWDREEELEMGFGANA